VIRYDATRITEIAEENHHSMHPIEWNETHSRCPRCGTWCHWREIKSDSCPVCRGEEVAE